MENETSGGGTPRARAPQPKLLRVLIPIVVILVLAGAVFFNSFYELNEDEFAVITTFGRPSVVSTPGLKFKLPVIQQKTIVSKATHGLTIGYDQRTNASIASESVMITVDYNFVNVDFYVEYRVTDPVKFLYHSADPVGILKMLCQSYIRDTIGLYKVDDVITTGKSEIQAAIKDKILARLEQEDLGLALVSISIQDAEPPTTEVQEAFKAVETAKQGAETAINNANKYARGHAGRCGGRRRDPAAGRGVQDRPDQRGGGAGIPIQPALCGVFPLSGDHAAAAVL